MSTADDVRAAMWRGYWRTRAHQMLIHEHFIIPLAKLLADRMKETADPGPEHTNGDSRA